MDTFETAKARFDSLPLPFKKDGHWRFSDLNFWGGEISKYLKVPAKNAENPQALDNECAKIFLKKLLGGGKFDAFCALDFPRAKIFFAPQNAKVKIASGELAKINIFEIGEGAEVEVFDERNFEGGEFCASANFYFVKAGAKLAVNTFFNCAENAPHYSRSDFLLQSGASVRDVFVEAGKSHSRAERNFELAGENADAQIGALMFGSGSAIHDLRTSQHHTSPHSSSSLAVKNILSDSSRAAFAGLIRVEEEAQKTQSYQSCRSLLVSEKARASGMPVLEILANDVMCSHGCAVSRPDKEQMFYMKSRGIGEKAAQNLLLGGFANEILEKFTDADFAERVKNSISL